MSILIVDDERNIAQSLIKLLGLEGYAAEAAEHALTAMELLGERNFDCILLDLKMPDIDGLELLQWITNRGISAPVIMMSAHGEIQDAVRALQAGAADYLVKPFDTEELLIRMKRAVSAHQLTLRFTAGLLEGRGDSGEAPSSPDPDGSSKAMAEVETILHKVSPTDTTVLITGESGTGKELTARRIHRMSARAEGPFVPVNVTGITESLLESELFGHEKGAFTGADRLRPGIFEAAQGGTVFLDEIGELPSFLQPKLLRVLQERKIRRVGSVHEIPVDIRIIAATNRDLEAMVRSGDFREDLYYRLNVVRLELPPLRERMDDLPRLVGLLLARISGRLGREVPEIDPRTLQLLGAYRYPGNVRELENLLERALILMEGKKLVPADFPGLEEQGNRRLRDRKQAEETGAAGAGLLDGSLSDIERRAIILALQRNGGNRSRTALQLGISRKTLIGKISSYGLEGKGGDGAGPG